MATMQRPRQSRVPSSRQKVPLTYYRSGAAGNKAAGSPFKRKDTKPGRWRIFLIRAIDLAVIAAVIFGIGYSLVVKPEPIIKANDYSYRPAKVYARAAAELLSSAKNRTKMTLEESSIAGPLRSRFPEISSMSIELPLVGQRPILHLTIAKPTLRLSGNDQSYIVDSEGVAVARSADLPAIKNLPLLNDQTGYDIKTGQQALSISSVKFISTLLAECKRAHIPVKSLTLPLAPLELDLRTSDEPYFVKLYLDGNALVQTGQFLAARHKFASGGGQPTQYLDVRVEGKVFYK